MSEFMGSEKMVALQQALRDRAAEFENSPLTANGGRIMNILEPDTYGWDNVRCAAERDGIVALTMVDEKATLARLEAAFGKEVEFPFWGAFTGLAEDVLPTCAGVVAGFALPEGWRVESFTHPDDETIHVSQALNQAQGVAPSPAYFLRGEAVPSVLTCVYNTKGAMIACASATMRYHAEGPLAGWIFAGSVTVDPDRRRGGLGSFVNARLLVDSHAAFGWRGVLEQAKADNAASVGMIRRCGLRQEGGKVTVIVNLMGGYVTR